MTFRFTAYVPDQIADWEPEISSSVAELLGNAERRCAALNTDPPRLASMDALARQLLRAEAVASSRIEGLVMSHRRLALAQAAAGVDATADQIVGNIHALQAAIAQASDDPTITSNTILEVHRALLAGTRDAHIAGVIRLRQNWIGGEASSPATAEFIPPPPDEVPGLLDDLARFLNRTDLQPAAQAAIAHAQFETIHPFADGNGRVGRALIHLVLRRRGTAPGLVPPVSLVFAADARRYIAGLTASRYGDMEDWLGVFAAALTQAADRSQTFAQDVTALQETWRAQAGTPRRGSSAAGVIQLLPGRPVLTTNDAAHHLGVSHEAARKAMLSLQATGVVRDRAAGRRTRVWEAVGLFDLLDHFERDIGPACRTPRPSQ